MASDAFRWVHNSWTGQERLYRVFWYFTLLPAAILIYCTDIAYAWGQAPEVLTYAVAVVWTIWITRSLWACSFNAALPVWGWAVRVMLLALFGFALSDLLFDTFP